jgi:hypothetical protein
MLIFRLVNANLFDRSQLPGIRNVNFVSIILHPDLQLCVSTIPVHVPSVNFADLLLQWRPLARLAGRVVQ